MSRTYEEAKMDAWYCCQGHGSTIELENGTEQDVDSVKRREKN